MTDTLITTVQTTTQTLDGADSLIVTPISGIYVNSGMGISISGLDNEVVVYGDVFATGLSAAIFASSTASDVSISVAAGANVSTSALSIGAINLESSGYVNNAGMVTSSGVGILMKGTGGVITNSGTVISSNDPAEQDFYSGILLMGQDMQVVNSGLIQAVASGIEDWAGTEGATLTIRNTGEIHGDLALDMDEGSTGTVVIDNFGLLSGWTGVAVSVLRQMDMMNAGDVMGDVISNARDDMLVNRGVIFGSVDLGDEADTYRAIGDGEVTGEINGGGGDDVLLGGSGEDEMIGGSENDVLRGRQGDDDLLGGAGNDVIVGGAGDDTLNGGSGQDVLTGATGDDIMKGGGGSDRFVFGLKSGDDVIEDFQNNLDVIDLRAYGITNTAELTAAGAIQSATGGSIIDLRLVGGDGTIFAEGMNVGDWNNADFLF